MAATYPGGIASFTTKVDNVTTVKAEHVNSLQDEVVALETALGTDVKGAALSVKDRFETLEMEPQPNILTNGDFSVHQRGTSGALAAGTHGWVADRWKIFRGAYVAGMYYSRGSYNRYSLPNNITITRSQGDTSLQGMYVIQDLETADSVKYQLKHLTVTVCLTKGAGLQGSLNVTVTGGKGTDQTLPSGYTSATTIISGNCMPSTVGPLSTFTFVSANPVPFDVTQLAVSITYTPSQATAPAGESFSIFAVKLEAGKRFTGWNFPDLAETVRKCRRYCFVKDFTAGYGLTWGNGYTTTTTAGVVSVLFPERMRVPPSMTASYTSVSHYQAVLSTGLYPLSVAPVVEDYSISPEGCALVLVTTGNPMPGGNYPLRLRGSDGAKLIFSAEL